jgi:hypothetical protein
MTVNDPVSSGVAGDAGRFCPDCGYDLRGIDSDRCPECGLGLHGAAGFAIPWSHRQEMGRARAFWRTVRLAAVHPKSLATAAGEPVEYAAAQRFRWLVVALASLPPIVFFLIYVWRKRGTRFLSVAGNDLLSFLPWLADPLREIALIWSAGATFAPVLPIGVVVMFFLATGAAGYWFRPGHLNVARQDRAVAISRYACAPLAWLPVPVAMAGVAVGLTATGFLADFPSPRDWLVLGAPAALILVAGWRTSLVLLGRTTHCGAGRLAAAAVGLPLSWLLSAVIGLGVLPFLIGFIWIVIDGFR